MLWDAGLVFQSRVCSCGVNRLGLGIVKECGAVAVTRQDVEDAIQDLGGIEMTDTVDLASELGCSVDEVERALSEPWAESAASDRAPIWCPLPC